MIWHFERLNDICITSDHADKVLMSSCSVTVECSVFSVSRRYENSLVSSANNEVKFLMWSEMFEGV